jgi:tripartite-type tricarboxylate transporter receptor subunit TctC
MKNSVRRTLVGNALRACVVVATASLFSGAALAQAGFPDKVIKLIVPYPAGGASDTVARIIGEKMSQSWGQPVIVDNKPGAAGIIGAHLVARAPADGYTVLIHNTSLIQQPYMMDKLPYDPMKDLAPVVRTVLTSNLFVVPLNSPARTMKEFVALAKDSKFSYGSYGIGSAAHVQGALLNQQTGLDLTHVPYPGSAPMIPNIISNQLSSAFIDVPSAMPHIKSMRPLAVSGTARLAAMPDVPTLTELGFKSFEPIGWHGMLVPAGTPAPVVDKLAAEVTRILRLPDVAAKIDTLGMLPGGGKPEDFSKAIRADSAIYADIIKAANIRVGQ